MTYEDLVAECRKLRAQAEAAESAYFVFLMKAEQEYAEVWHAAGCASFEQFLRSNELTEVKRYYDFVRGVKRTSPEKALKNGVPLTTRIGRTEEIKPEAVADLCKRAEAFVDVLHVAPKEKTVARWAAEVVASERTTGCRTGSLDKKNENSE